MAALQPSSWSGRRTTWPGPGGDQPESPQILWGYHARGIICLTQGWAITWTGEMFREFCGAAEGWGGAESAQQHLTQLGMVGGTPIEFIWLRVHLPHIYCWGCKREQAGRQAGSSLRPAQDCCGWGALSWVEGMWAIGGPGVVSESRTGRQGQEWVWDHKAVIVWDCDQG